MYVVDTKIADICLKFMKKLAIQNLKTKIKNSNKERKFNKLKTERK